MSVPQLYQQAPGNFQDKIRYTDSIISMYPDLAYTKGSGYKQYMRQKSFWEPRLAGYLNPEEGRRNQNKALYQHALDHEARANSFKTNATNPSWNLVSDFNGMGTTTVNGTTYTSSISTGLVNDIEIDPTDPNSWTIAVAGGGVWQTSNQGIEWYDLDPNKHLPIQDAWDVEINPSDPNEIFVALTGYPASIIGISTYSLGVYKTTNNGQYWFHCDTIGNVRSDSLRDSWAVRRVKVDRLDNDRVYAYGSLNRSAALLDQFWYSESKGDTFARVDLYPFFGNAYKNRLKASGDEIYEDIHVTQTAFHDYIYLSGQNLLRSSDQGQTWVDITMNLAFLNDNSKLCYGYYPMEMRLASNDTLLYVVYNVQRIPFDTLNSYGDSLYHYYGEREWIYLEYSSDWGDTWNAISQIDSTKLSSHNNLPIIPGGELSLEIAPGDNSSTFSNNRIIAGYVDYALSNDGGQNSNRISEGYTQTFPSSKWIHPDNRGLRLLPGSGANIEIISANDGGVAYSSNSGNSWNIRNDGLHAEPLGGIGLWEENSDTLMAGAIHIGGILKLGKNCYTTRAGDYGDAVLGKRISGVFPFAGVNLPFNLYENNGKLIVNNATKHSTGCYPKFPLAIHPTNPSVVCSGLALGATATNIPAGYSRILQSTDAGGSWAPATNGETNGVKNFCDISFCKSFPFVMYAIAAENIFYNNTSRFSQIIYKSTNAGMGWFDITGDSATNPLMFDHLKWIHNATGIVADPDDSAKVFIYYSSFGDQENAARVVMSTDGGLTFSDISQGLPAFPVTDLVCVPGEEDEMFLANDVNVYYTNKDLNNVWSLYDNGLPTGMMRDLEYHYKDRKLFVATTGRGIWETELPCDSISSTPTTISGSVLWETDRSPYGHIIIPANCTLTIKNCQIRMRDNQYIAVERGGLLILERATLTSCSNTTQWSGIMVWGNSSIQVQSYAPYGNFGKVVMLHSIIENAKNGVILCKLDYSTYVIDYSTCGGIIDAQHCTFKNCRKSIAFMKHPAPYYNSILLDCDFINTRSNTSAAPVFVSLWGVKEVSFDGCRFSNYDPSEDYEMRGIYSIDATYQFRNYVGYWNTFNNLAYGIMVENSISVHHIDVDKCRFVNCARGIFLSNANFSRVTHSEFQIRNYNPLIPYGRCLIQNQFGDSYGIYTDFTNAFTIEENEFSSYGTLAIHDTTLGYDRQNGCVIRNNYGYADELYRNKFGDLLVGVKSVGINRELKPDTIPNPMFEYETLSKGLQVRCNEFKGNIPYTDIGVLGLVSEYQGKNTPLQMLAAGNNFATASTPITNGPGKNIWYIPDYPGMDTIMGYSLDIINDSLNHMYYIHDIDGNMTPTRLQYAILDSVFVDSTTSTNQFYIPENTCPKRILSVGNDPQLPWEIIDAYNDSITVGTALLDLGNSDDLIDAIDNESIEDAKDLLDAASPYLSDRVLTHIIDQAYIEYASEWKDVLVNNSPLASQIYPLTFEIEMPTEDRGELAAAQLESFSPRDYLKAKITHYKDSVDLHLKKSSEYIFPRVCTSTSSRDSILALYEKDRSVHTILKRIDFCLYTDEYSQYEQLIDTLEAADTEIYHDLAEILRDLSSVYNSPEGITAIDPTMKTTLEDYVEDRKPFYERFENILISRGDRTRCYPDITIKYGLGGSGFKHEFPDASLKISLIEGWNSYPNPSEGELFEFLKSELNEPYEISLYDITGKVVTRISRNTSNKKYSIQTEEFPKGIYFAQVITQSGKKYTHKLLLK